MSEETEDYLQIPVFTYRNAVPPKRGVLVVIVNSPAAQQAICQRVLEWESSTCVVCQERCSTHQEQSTRQEEPKKGGKTKITVFKIWLPEVFSRHRLHF